MSIDRYLKEDPERADSVLETLLRHIQAYTWRNEYDQPSTLRDWIWQQKPFLMDVFRAVRGERD